MISKERVEAAFAFEQGDRPPLDYYATPEIHTALSQHFGVTSENEIREALGSDIRFVNPRYVGPELPEYPDGSKMNFWGIIKKPMPNEYGDYMESTNWPYAEWSTVEEAEQFRWPTPDWFEYDSIPAQCAEHPDKAIFTGQFSIQDFINGVAFGRGVEQTLIDIALEDPVYLYIVEKRHRFYMEYMERILQAANGAIDVVLCGDDFGTQRGLLISPASFDSIFAPRKKEFFDMVHSYGAKVTHHCCGSSRELIPRFLELGMDALQTIQPQAQGMDPYDLKKTFHGELVLHGGVDVQGWLQAATPDEVRNEIGRLREIVGAGGGYIMSPSHHIQPDTPVENVLAFYEAATAGRPHGG
jgi:uroporphyrinogen decarboxylase